MAEVLQGVVDALETAVSSRAALPPWPPGVVAAVPLAEVRMRLCVCVRLCVHALPCMIHGIQVVAAVPLAEVRVHLCV